METEIFCAIKDEESLSVQGSMHLILSEVKSLRRVITHLSKEVLSLRNEVRQLKNIQEGTKPAKQSTHLPVMPFNEKTAFDKFIKELADKESVLNEFKTFLLRLDATELAGFLRAAMKAVLTDNLAQQFSWKGTKRKPALIGNVAVTVIKEICYRHFPNADDFRINTILQKHLIYAKDRIEKKRKRHSEGNS
ncbi:uncharacterized protein LOC101458105 isoform X2 [Ceratitis capitata]|uniref:(Mediterranean fruit fly) hypothetical protein n=1 Tax=Ceratitis capitata TaxID=7213 RepID=A0A811UGD4_CERCA|nr:uncharacterized protein LOC101458105 isoform X2 [Ceratitis capitata]CAD6996645.1 unnamed protein product [Ceratitis capitata]